MCLSDVEYNGKEEVIGLGSKEKMAAFVEKTSAKNDRPFSDKKSVERLSALFDANSFVALDSLVVSRPFRTVFDRPPVEGDGVEIGYGTIDGRLVYAAAQDPSVYGGSMGKIHAEKIVKAIRFAITAGAPFVFLISSGGARIEEGIVALEGLSSVISAMVEAKGVIPLLGAVLGPCPGGLAIAAAKMDFLFFVDKVSGMYMNSPSVTATVSKNPDAVKTIGTASVHAHTTGLASFVLPDEKSCFDQIVELLSYLPVQSGEAMQFSRTTLTSDDANRCDEALNAMASSSDDSNIDVAAVLSSVADGRKILISGRDFGADVVTAFARMDGIPVGFIANRDSRITSNGAKKAAAFVDFCTGSMLPIITFTQAEGFAIGEDVESSDIITAAADLVTSFATSDVPRIGILTGKALGTAYISMNSKMLGADIVYAWPTAEIAVMKADTAATILFKDEIKESEDPAACREEKVRSYAEEIASPSVACGLGQVDEIILPSATRARIISALDMLLTAYPMTDCE